MTISLTFDIDGADRLIAGLAVAPAVLEAAKADAMTKSVFLLEAAVKGRTPRVTGRLFSSIHGEVNIGPALQGRVSTSVHYAPWVEGGRGPVTAQHMSGTEVGVMTGRARPGVLRFRIGPTTLFRRSVGPALGRYMFREGLAATKPAILDIFRDAMRRVADAIRGVR